MLGIACRHSRRYPYVAIFSTVPASTIDAASGASACARGSHIWRGTRGVFVANAITIPSHTIEWLPISSDVSTS